jgi:DNA polymerase-1
VPVPLDDLSFVEPEPRALVAFLKAMEFTTITRKLAEEYGIDVSAVEPDPRLMGTGKIASPGEAPAPLANGAAEPAPAAGGWTPADLASARRQEGASASFDTAGYETVLSPERLEAWIAEATRAGVVAIDLATDHADSMQATIVGISLATAPGRACYVPLGHREGGGDLFDRSQRVAGQIPAEQALARLKPLLESAGVLKIGQDMKPDWLLLARHGITMAPLDDTMLISYALDAGIGSHAREGLAEKWLGHKPAGLDSVTGTGKARVSLDLASIAAVAGWAGESADVALRLWRVLKPRLVAERQATVYETLERPLVATLARMERRGIAIDRAILSRLSGDFAQRMGALEEEIQQLAGEPFNLGSPKQLGDILFGKMQLPGGKKTATGQWATGAQALEELAEQGHALPARILDWRQLSKLKSTYTDALPTYVNRETGRVHTSFALAATATGRLSSSEPNIQNIPVRNEEGRKIRTAFVAAPGHRLISADYSQIELRVLAHMADIPALRQAFAEGLDIHAMTASEMFGVPVKDMPSEVRRRAKAINFGIIYGISAFGLANQLGIGREEAGAYIKKYFERFPGIRDYMDRMKKEAHDHGYVRTIFGRKCHYPQINTRNPSERAFYERAAINAPIQGSAADIIRRAMVRMDAALVEAKLSAAMLLQVHDELVFEVPESEVEAAIPVIRRVMEAAPLPAVSLAVPLKVDARAALNWDEAH